MRLLIIEDTKESVKGIMDFANKASWEMQCEDFTDAEAKIREFAPDIVVLDWMFDVEEAEKGKQILETIWENNFIPIIIFSALASTITLDEKYLENPLISLISKGDEEPVVEKLKEWEKYTPAIKNLRDDMNKALITSLRTIEIFNASEFPGDDVVKYMLTKRTANYFDKDFEGTNPPAWIQYIYPAMSDTFLVCDVLRKVSSEADHAKEGEVDEYSVILTPSCDIVNDNTPQLLVASCECKEKYCNIELGARENITSGKGKEKVEDMEKNLNRGHVGAKVALPKLSGILPYLTIDLKKVQLILKEKTALSRKTIIPGTHEYYRVASIDSPFREQIVWAHMLNSCRPGMPDRDTVKWAEEILAR